LKFKSIKKSSFEPQNPAENPDLAHFICHMYANPQGASGLKSTTLTTRPRTPWIDFNIKNVLYKNY
jgi:hypothetical protein